MIELVNLPTDQLTAAVETLKRDAHFHRGTELGRVAKRSLNQAKRELKRRSR